MIESAVIDDLQQMVQMEKRFFEHIVGEQTGFLCSHELININDFNKAVRIDDYVYEKICDNIGICVGCVMIVNNIAVPVQK